jgi:hypothetical protein
MPTRINPLSEPHLRPRDQIGPREHKRDPESLHQIPGGLAQQSTQVVDFDNHESYCNQNYRLDSAVFEGFY